MEYKLDPLRIHMLSLLKLYEILVFRYLPIWKNCRDQPTKEIRTWAELPSASLKYRMPSEPMISCSWSGWWSHKGAACGSCKSRYLNLGFHITMLNNCTHQWIGLRENLQETIDFPIKYGAFRFQFSLKPIHERSGCLRICRGRSSHCGMVILGDHRWKKNQPTSCELKKCIQLFRSQHPKFKRFYTWSFFTQNNSVLHL